VGVPAVFRRAAVVALAEAAEEEVAAVPAVVRAGAAALVLAAVAVAAAVAAVPVPATGIPRDGGRVLLPARPGGGAVPSLVPFRSAI